ncbi:hypothetical protein QCA50_012326 [Cerrena zonata]|uniref:Uncharacterized protein n=1 Tax=Cerrena zonata TaxID=2478898 RepID=A0AAW0FZ64_9APHY
MPALYAPSLGVRDFDEARGIGVFGNAFGKLCIYDFSGSDPSHFQECYKRELHADSYMGEELLPTKPIPSIACPPFPYNQYLTKYDKLYAFWRSHRPLNIPHNWSTDFKDEEYVELYSSHISLHTAFSLDIERAAHYYGRPIPLFMHNAMDTAIISIGGLLFIWAGEDSWSNGLTIAKPNLTLPQVVDLLNSHRLRDVSAVHVAKVDAQTVSLSAFRWVWLWEVYSFRRNRWRELARRGGRVEDDRLDDEEIVRCVRIPPSTWKKYNSSQARNEF